MKRTFRNLFLLCFLAFGLTAAAVQAAVNISRLGAEQGLSNNYIMGMAQDRNGFVWVSTESGLNRFDGTRFRPFRKGGGNSPMSNELNRIYADTTANVLWIANQRHGLDRLDCSDYTFTHYRPDPSNQDAIGSPGVTDIAPAAGGKLWVATYTDGIDLMDPGTGKFSHFNSRTVDGWPDDHVWTMRENAGMVYVGHVNCGFSVFDPLKKSVRNFMHDVANPASLPGNGVRAVLPDNNGNVWVGTDGGLALFNPETETFTCFRHEEGRRSSLVSNSVYGLMTDSHGRLWVSTENGGVSILDLKSLVMKSPSEVEFVNMLPEGGDGGKVSNKTVHCTFEDSFGNIWIGTYGDGIDMICHTALPFGHGATRNPVTSLALRGNTLFVGSDGGGLDVLSLGGGDFSAGNALNHLKGKSVLASMVDSHGTLWIGTYDGSVAVIPADSNIPGILDAVPGSDVRCFAETPEGDILAGNGQGIIRFSPDGKVKEKRYTADGKLSDEWIRTILVRPDGNIWVGSFGGGVTVYSSDFKQLYKAATWTGLHTNTVNQLIDAGSHVWAATGDGLVKLTPEAEIDTIIDAASGLADANIRGIKIDREGCLWMTTGSGISVMRPDGTIANFGNADGVTNGDFSGASVAEGEAGELFFGSHFGIHYLDRDLLKSVSPVPAPVITSVIVYGRDNHQPEEEIFAPVGKLEFPYDRNTLRVSFNILDAAQTSAVEYWYKVEGVDSRWYEGDSSTGVFLRNLPPGNYRLTVKACRRNSPSVYAQTELAFVITPPLWATWWAKLLYAVAVILAAWFAIRFYKKRLALEYALDLERQNSRHEQELNAERLRFFTNITHELRTPLTLILGPLDDMKSDKSLSADHSRKIGVIHKSASRLIDLINSILEFRRTETQNRELRVAYGDLGQLVADIGGRYRELNTNAAVDIRIDVEEGDFRLWYDPEIVAMIVDNLLSNACKYTVAGVISLKLYHCEESGVPFTEIAVSDTGIGMGAETLRHIFDRYYRDRSAETKLGTGIGLALVYNLVKIHEGEIFAESEPDRGSTFRFRLHTDNSYPNADRRAEGYLCEAEKEAVVEEVKTSESPERPTVLVVEDNVDIINYINSSLESEYDVVSATNGSEGLAKARSILPDIIISDIMMPKMDGISMVRALKSAAETEYIPVIIVTAKIAEDARREAYEAGADSYITKPFSSSLLRSRIANIMSSRHKLARGVMEKDDGKDDGKIDEESPIVSSLSEKDAEFIEKVSSIISDNISGDSLDVGFIADAMCMSHSTLYRKVKAVTGLTVAGMIRRMRARAAAELLATGRYTVSEIAFMVGMGSPGNFRQCFKEEFGVLPSEYKPSDKL